MVSKLTEVFLIRESPNDESRIFGDSSFDDFASKNKLTNSKKY